MRAYRIDRKPEEDFCPEVWTNWNLGNRLWEEETDRLAQNRAMINCVIG